MAEMEIPPLGDSPHVGHNYGDRAHCLLGGWPCGVGSEPQIGPLHQADPARPPASRAHATGARPPPATSPAPWSRRRPPNRRGGPENQFRLVDDVQEVFGGGLGCCNSDVKAQNRSPLSSRDRIRVDAALARSCPAAPTQ